MRSLVLCTGVLLLAALAPAGSALAAEVTLSTPVSGVVSAIPARSGKRYGKGEVLVQLEDSVFQAQLTAAEAHITLQTRLLKEHERELERAQEMYDNSNLSDHELELARIALDRARADYHTAAAQLAEARFELYHSAVRAPYDGVVKAILVSTGQTVINREQATPMVKFAR